MTIRGLVVALSVAVLLLHQGSASASPPDGAPPPEFHTGPPTAEDLRRAEERRKLDDAFEQAKVGCDKLGLVTLVSNLTPDGRQVRFDCVGADNPEYKAQHSDEETLPPPPTDLDSVLQPKVGKDVYEAIPRLRGYSGHLVGDSLEFTWDFSRTVTLRGTIFTKEDLTELCKVKVMADRVTHIIQRYEWTEKRGGCSHVLAEL